MILNNYLNKYSHVEIKLRKSLIGSKKCQIQAAHCLGLKKINNVMKKKLNLPILGMIRKINHIIDVKFYNL